MGTPGVAQPGKYFRDTGRRRLAANFTTQITALIVMNFTILGNSETENAAQLT
jgi:hypothetical protein